MRELIQITEHEWHEIKRGLSPLWWLRLTAKFSKKNRELLQTILKVESTKKVKTIKPLKHLLFILFPFAAFSQESQPPTFLLPGETVTATDSAYLIGMDRLRHYEKAVDLVVNGSDPTAIFETYEQALKESNEKFDRLLTLHTRTTGEIKLGIEKSSEVNRDAIARLRSLAQQNADLLNLAHETRKDVKRLTRRQFWNKLGILSMGVVAGGVAVFVLAN